MARRKESRMKKKIPLKKFSITLSYRKAAEKLPG
jgi:hypothetical protein